MHHKSKFATLQVTVRIDSHRKCAAEVLLLYLQTLLILLLISIPFYFKGVSSLYHLLSTPLLRAAVWGISCATCLGNALVLWGRLTAKDENQVLSIVIRNLAGKTDAKPFS